VRCQVNSLGYIYPSQPINGVTEPRTMIYFLMIVPRLSRADDPSGISSGKRIRRHKEPHKHKAGTRGGDDKHVSCG